MAEENANIAINGGNTNDVKSEDTSNNVKHGEEGKEEEKLDEKKYGGCEGPNSMFVTLISSDGQKFIIEKKFAYQSETIKMMLTGPGQCTENETNVIHFREIQSHILDVVCKYFMYRHRYSGSSGDLPPFTIDPRMAVDMLKASRFLDC